MKFHLFFQPFKMLFILLFYTIGTANSFPQRHRTRSVWAKNPFYEGQKIRGGPRDMDVADSPLPKKGTGNMELDFMKELERLLNDTKMTPGLDGCPDCKKLLEENQEERQYNYEAKPAYHCDRWDPEERICWLDRNVGNTVTFVLALPPQDYLRNHSKVEWKQVFHTLHEGEKKSFDIDPTNPPWNVVVGSGGYELRLSPITEVDVDYNYYTAFVLAEESHSITENTVHFRIRAMAVDQGLVYPGASLMINMHSFVSLPEESMAFRWSLEKEPHSSLPSNMRLSMSGSVLSISELRKEQEGIVVCSVYTNLGIFATQKRFLIRGVNRGNNLLVFEATRPPFNPQVRRRREIAPSDEEEEEDDVDQKDEDGNSKPDENNSEDDTEQEKGSDDETATSNETASPPFMVAEEDNDDVLAVEVKVPEHDHPQHMRVSDKLSMMLSTCRRNTECSIYAECNRLERKRYGFCRCFPRFEGTGVFCWEVYKVKT